MNLKAVLFDLDGTLLPMDLEIYTEEYFKCITARFTPLGYDPKRLISSIGAGIEAMIKNDGSRTNEEAFWDIFVKLYDQSILLQKPVFEDFYKTDFNKIKSVCGFNPEASKTVRGLKAAGIRTVLATNPIFPRVAVDSRIRWAGLEPEDFCLITSYENTRYCKPRAEYYAETVKQLGLQPQECLMVGNDVDDDMPAAKTGMKVFLLTNDLINRSNTDISLFPHGGFDELSDFLNGTSTKSD